MIYIDSDNALGSPSGDIDDAFAIAALLRSGLPVAALGSVFGNTSAAEALRNNEAIARRCAFGGTCLQGASHPGEPSDASRYLASGAPIERALALGPLTNFAVALRQNPRALQGCKELIWVGANRTSRGRWPPYWPFEFNLTHDRDAACEVFESPVPLTIIPLDQARRLRLYRNQAELAGVTPTLATYLTEGSRRWLRRAALWRLSPSVPVWDLVAALWMIEPSRFQTEETVARIHSNGWVEFGPGDRPVRVITGFDPAGLWGTFREAVSKSAAN